MNEDQKNNNYSRPEIKPLGTVEVSRVGLRPRSIMLGITLALLICAVTPFNNSYRHGTPLGGGHFPLAPFFILFWLTILISLAGKLFKKNFLTGRELVVTWILMVIASGIAYTGLVRTFFLNLTVPYYFSTVGNRWRELLQPLLPKSWYPQDEQAIKAIYEGLDGGRGMGWLDVIGKIPWAAWIWPLLVWGAFILLCYFVIMCLVNILSRQWIHNERMNFPLLQAPLMLEEAKDGNNLSKILLDNYMLAGILVPVVLHLMNGLHFYIPSVPQLPTIIVAGSYFPQFGLFSAFTKLKICIYPAFIGFAFLTARQISFSFWFFYIIGGLLIGFLSVLGYSIPASALGVTFGPHLTRPEETQMIGAYGVFFLFIVWLGRYQLSDVIKEAFGIKKSSPSRTEWISVRYSFWGFTLGVIAIIFWMNHFGMPLVASFLLCGAFFMVILVATRVVCQGGIAYFTLTAAPIDGLLAFFGPGFFTNAGLVVAGVIQKMLFLDFRESLMPSLFHAAKINQTIRSRRLFLTGIMLTLVLAVAVSFLAMIALCYKYGIRELQLDWATRTTVTTVTNVKNLIESPVQPGSWVYIFTIFGAAVMLVLVVCYHRFYWWPIHPIGYLTTYSASMRILWFSFFIGWAVNALCMRYGGIALFKRLRLFFIGLIIGDFLMGGIWAVVGLFQDASYLVLPD